MNESELRNIQNNGADYEEIKQKLLVAKEELRRKWNLASEMEQDEEYLISTSDVVTSVLSICPECTSSEQVYESTLEHLSRREAQFKEAKDKSDAYLRDLKSVLEDKEFEIARLRAELKDTSAIQESIIDLKAELNEANEILDNLVKENTSLKINLDNIESEFEEFMPDVCDMKEKLSNSRELIKELSCNNAKLRSEIAAASSVSDHKTKGNSVFSEASDHCQEAYKKLKMLKISYCDLKSSLECEREKFNDLTRTMNKLKLHREQNENTDLRKSQEIARKLKQNFEEKMRYFKELETQLTEAKSKVPGNPECSLISMHSMLNYEKYKYAEIIKEFMKVHTEKMAVCEKALEINFLLADWRKNNYVLSEKIQRLKEHDLNCTDESVFSKENICKEIKDKPVKSVHFSSECKSTEKPKRQFRPQQNYPRFRMRRNADGKVTVIKEEWNDQ